MTAAADIFRGRGDGGGRTGACVGSGAQSEQGDRGDDYRDQDGDDTVGGEGDQRTGGQQGARGDGGGRGDTVRGAEGCRVPQRGLGVHADETVTW